MRKLLTVFAFLAIFAFDASAGKLKTNYRNALIFAYSQANSVYEDDNIILEIYNEQLWAKNKTSKTIFIDLAQCFVIHNGSSRPFVPTGESDKASKKDNRKASKAGESSIADKYITIAPSISSEQKETYICNMSTLIYGKYTTIESPSEDFSDYDKRLLGIIEELLTESKNADPKGKEYMGTVARHLTEDESVNNIGASVAYAFNKNTEDWTNVTITTWVSDVILAPFFVEMPKDLTKKEMRGFGIKETAPAIIHVRADSPFEFDEDKSPILVCDWVGDYKKGTFTLYSTWISKTKGSSVLQIIVSPREALKETAYKKVIQFDGAESDWGKISYAVGGIMETGQNGDLGDTIIW